MKNLIIRTFFLWEEETAMPRKYLRWVPTLYPDLKKYTA